MRIRETVHQQERESCKRVRLLVTAIGFHYTPRLMCLSAFSGPDAESRTRVFLLFAVCGAVSWNSTSTLVRSRWAPLP